MNRCHQPGARHHEAASQRAGCVAVFGLVARVAVLLAGAAAAETAVAAEATSQKSFKTYCVDCHDDASATAGLSLESLAADYDNPAWVRIHDRIKSGEMPPADAPQPSSEERAAAVAGLAAKLTAAASARQKAEGRVVLRRMNRREYEHTLHDLFGIAEPLVALLPEDTVVHGFDTTSSGLETSATHLLRYQSAAERALAAALPAGPVVSKVVRWTGKEYLEKRLPVHRTGIDPFVRVDGDAIVLHAVLYGDNSMQAPQPLVPGRYRIRASVRLVNCDKPMAVLIGKRVDRFQTEKLMHIVDYQDVKPGETKILEAETDLKYSNGNQFVYFQGQLPWFGELEKSRGDRGKQPLEQDFAGPGLAIDWAELEGPLDAGLGYQRMFGDLPRQPRMPEGKEPPKDWEKWQVGSGEYAKWPLIAVSIDPKADADRLIRGFLPLAFRRPVADDLAAHYVSLVHGRIDKGESFDEAMRAGYKAILCSPHFLTFIEPPGRLDDYTIAARLARFLWSATPDEQLLAAAAKGSLSTPEGLRAQADRMLADPKSARFVKDFTDQWLDLRKFLDMKPDDIYAEYDEMLTWSIPIESRRFFAHVLAEDLPATNFFHSDWTILNGRLAQHYGVDGVEGAEFRKVSLQPKHHRGGVITQASFLKMSTNASYTSPVKRGAWVLERILGTPSAAPPPNVKAIEPDIRGATTIREQLTLHKNVEACASCHRQIDPPGFALENFDVVGGWRERYRVKQGGDGIEQRELPGFPGKKVYVAKPVEAGGETADGKSFQDIDAYKQIVLERDADQLARNMVEKLIVYATGAPIDFADRASVEQILRDTKSRQHGLRSLVLAVIQSPAFLNK
jgi:mono/diheme cytochrome c family protein